MSYYGYPNAQAYGANYAQYAAAYAAGSSYDQYQAAAAYNAAAYNAMQQQQRGQVAANASANGQTAAKSVNGVAGISISQPAQRYDYASMQAPSVQGGPTAGYDAAAYASNMMGGAGVARPMQPNVPKWGQLPGQPGANQFNKKPGPNQFNRRRNPAGASVQVFYCEVCKISCAGPQTYKEHLDGQKHKKREQASKINEQQQQQQQQQLQNTTVAATSGGAVISAGPTLNANAPIRARNPQQQMRTPPGRLGNLSRNNVVIRCELCDVACTGRDAYSAHVRGMKHQKTIKLHQKLGKPIPPDALDMLNNAPKPAVNPQQTGGGGVSFPQAAIISAPPLINMNRPLSQQVVASPIIGPVEPVTLKNNPVETGLCVNSNLSSTCGGMQSEVDNNQPGGSINENEEDEDVVNIEPIGKEYIETRLEGKILAFYCKLCECQFNDPNAKDMHTKGRRHRLAYKKKVDPSLRVDMKGNTRDTLKNQRDRQGLDMRSRNTSMTSSSGGPQSGPQIKPLMSGDGQPGSNNSPQNIQQLMSQPLKTINSNQYNQFGFTNNVQIRNTESFDDRHIIAKHNAIYPSQEEINEIQEIVVSTEKALKLVSDQIADEDQVVNKFDGVVPKSESVPIDETGKKSEENQVNRALKGVLRVGLLAKGLLLKGDTDVQLIVLCDQKPTKALLERVHKILLDKIDIVSPTIKYSIILDKEAETIVIIKTSISDVQPLITCKVLLTSPSVRTLHEQLADQAAADAAAAEGNIKQETVDPPKAAAEDLPEIDSANLLDKQRCLDSLASLRHAKWFQARASNVPNCVIIIRVLRDLCRRNPTWTPLSQWGLELLVEKSLSSSLQPLSPGEGLRRVLECISSGVILPNGPGLYDPCEKEPSDVADCLKCQQREELTSSAQMALRLLAFKQIYKILGMECLNSHSNYNYNQTNKMARKRQHCPNGNESQIEEKKEKKDCDEEPASEVATALPSLTT